MYLSTSVVSRLSKRGDAGFVHPRDSAVMCRGIVQAVDEREHFDYQVGRDRINGEL